MSTQRKAWNEAMKKAASGSIPIPGLPVSNRRSSNRSTRNKRREKARKAYGGVDDDGTGGGNGDNIDLVEFRIDSLEEASSDLLTMMDDEEEYDELEDLEETSGGKKRRKRKKKKNDISQSGKLPKRLKARSLASVLIEESTRGQHDGVLQQYLDAEAVRPISDKNRYSRRKFCPVSGLEGIYRDPKSGIPYATLTALEQIRERPPPWITGLNNAGSAAYYEAVKSLKNED
jgi:hypothetical protein